MMKSRSARNPARRNRNIGTSRSGHGEDNRLVVPDSPSGRAFFERLGKHSAATTLIQNLAVTFIVEKTRTQVLHACTVDDLVKMLGAIPAQDWDGIEYLVLRQTKRKEEILKPSWGRLVYHYEYRGRIASAIILDTNAHDKPIRWGRHLDPEDQMEIARLRSDGMEITETKRGYLLQTTMESTRRVQLFRTLLHEIGHWVDYRRTPESIYDTKASRDKEAFAHRYSVEMGRRLKEAGVIPFDRVWSDRWTGIDKTDFFPN